MLQLIAIIASVALVAFILAITVASWFPYKKPKPYEYDVKADAEADRKSGYSSNSIL